MTVSLNSAVTDGLRQLLLPVALTQCEGRTIVSFAGRGRICTDDEAAYRPPYVHLGEEGLHALATVGQWARGLNDTHREFACRFGALESIWFRKAGPETIVHGALAGWQLHKALQMLGEHLDLAIELDDIALGCRVSRAHFAKAFRRSMGVPPYRWRLELRLAKARRALIETLEPLTRIARMLGFQQMTHFSHAFVRATGMSPRQWRRTFQSTHWVGVQSGHAIPSQNVRTDFGDDLFVHLELLHSVDDSIVDAIRTLLTAALREESCLDGSTEVLVEALHLCSGQARLAEKPCKASRGKLADWQVTLARQLLATPSEDASIAVVAAACGTSPGYFSKAFRATLGICPRRWQAHARVEQAKALLESSTRMMIDIAGECGFTEQSHFNHTFTRLVGCNPGAWRTLHQQAGAC
jgi:AraC-like DNA-binding protein